MIRLMHQADIEPIVEIEMMVFKETLGSEMFLREIETNPLAHYYVYVLDNKVIGYIGTWINDMAGEVINFCIATEFQGHGYGDELLSYALDVMKEAKINSVSLEVRESNIKAIKLYQKYGFKQVHVRKEYYHNLENALVMIKEM